MLNEEKDDQQQPQNTAKRSLLYRLLSMGKEREPDQEKSEDLDNAIEANDEEIPKLPPQPKVTVPTNSSLYQFWVQWRAASQKDQQEPITLADDLKELPDQGMDFAGEKAAFLIELINTANTISKKLQADTAAAATRLPESVAPAPVPTDAILKVRASKDWMQVWMFAFPPREGGCDITVEMIQAELSRLGVTYGVKQDKMEQVAKELLYYRVVLIAQGMAAVPGIDGRIEDCVSRTDEVDIREKDDGSVNYKDMNLMRCVAKDTVLCRIVKPIEAVKGMNVKGRPIPASPGRNPVVPKGENTLLSADGTELLAAIDGHVSFVGDRFRVKKQLVISGDVDNSVGNLDFMGDILVFGDVREGFIIKARGDVSVEGSVEGASIYADGNIRIRKGMNGNGKGLLSAGQNLTCKYLENCTATAKGDIIAGSIVCCNVSSNNKVQVLSDKGAIIGGTLTVLHAVEAKAIGSKSSRVTEIFLGYTPSMLTEKNQLETQAKEIVSTLEELSKDITYLERLNSKEVDSKRAETLSSLKLKRSLQLIQQDKLSKRLVQLNAEIEDLNSCHVRSTVIYPFTKITIGGASRIVQKVEKCCNVFYSNNSVVLGSQ